MLLHTNCFRHIWGKHLLLNVMILLKMIETLENGLYAIVRPEYLDFVLRSRFDKCLALFELPFGFQRMQPHLP